MVAERLKTQNPDEQKAADESVDGLTALPPYRWKLPLFLAVP
jgi:hypothetical protein